MDILQAPITFIGVLVGSIFTILGIFITNRANTKRVEIQHKHEKETNKENLMRDRLEELYILSDKYFNTLVSHQLPLRMVMKGEISFNDALDLQIERGKEKKFDYNRVNMIIEMYFNELQEPYSEVLKIRDELNNISEGYKNQYKTGDYDGRKWLDLFQPKLELLTQKTGNFKNKLTKFIKNV
ncbi:MAG: hypothetical protein JJV94_06180 [Sulfurospirillum sp.]|nr:hypothetical protein [Sulfurospirillum sp.]